MPRLRKSMGENSDITNEDKAKSVEDWGKIKTEILKLKCNQYGIISTGKKIDRYPKKTLQIFSRRWECRIGSTHGRAKHRR